MRARRRKRFRMEDPVWIPGVITDPDKGGGLVEAKPLEWYSYRPEQLRPRGG